MVGESAREFASLAAQAVMGSTSKACLNSKFEEDAHPLKVGHFFLRRMLESTPNLGMIRGLPGKE